MAVGPALLDAIAQARAVKDLGAALLPAIADPLPDTGASRDARAAGHHFGLLGLRASACTVVASHLARAAAGRRAGPLVYLAADATTLEDAREDFVFLLGAERVAAFPTLDVPPYGLQIPRAAMRASRIETLARLLAPEAETPEESLRPWVLLTTPGALFQRIPAPAHFGRFRRTLRVGERIPLEELLALLVRLGYQGQPLVGEYGDFSRRGGIVDIYSFGRLNPVRLEFDDDEIVSLREFDVFSQRSQGVLSELTILPLWEVMIDADDWARASRRGSMPADGPVRERLDMLRNEGSFEGIEWMLEGLGIPCGTLLDFAGPRAFVVADDPLLLEARLEEAREEVRGAAAGEAEDASLFSPPEALFVMRGGLGDLLATHPAIFVGIGARSPAEAQTGPREATPPNKGWTAAEQLHPPDLLEEDVAPLHGSDAWRKLVARSARLARQRSAPPPGEASGSPDEAFGLTGRPDLTALEPALLAEETGWADEEEGSLLVPYATRYFSMPARSQERFGRNLGLVRDYIGRLHEGGMSVTVLCDSDHHRDRLEELMEKVPARFVVGNLAGGFAVPELSLALLTDHEIFERLRRRQAGRRFSRGISLKELLAMRPGDFVVHIDHGIGVYRGIERLPVNGQLTDCMKLEYAGGDKLFIPVDQLNLVQKYAAEEGHRPALSKLGTNQWAKTKAKVKQSIRDMAMDLARLYAVRKSRPGHAYPPDTVWQTEMEARFPYDETPDQLKAIEDVKGDMERAMPMDRLICGDVGYGKTEVAIRAAFKAVMDGRQVAVLVPTTLLAEQHRDTFAARLQGAPVRVEMLSRFRTRPEIQATLKDMAEGKVDIAIGTHRLLQKDVKFKDLGLVVVDEEQRFGVAHKERLKQLRSQVDVLTMTATPIPRTMHMALLGARDMSTIATPPRDRRPIRTEIVEFGDEVIAYALMREADRGGQSFFVHNRVESIDAIANYIRRLVPHLRIAVGHGQMRERPLEDVMRKFLDREFDVLVSTMIIESGLDLPNVNTILVNRTDTFGLAQLYQLRGRVGRSTRLAYAYLLLPPQRVITEQAMKRLKAIEEFEDLGSGFQLAMRDLEIRGAGNILGSQQHGFILNVGFDLYTRLLEEAMHEIQGTPVETAVETRIVTDLPAFLPQDYVPDDPEKMNLYKSLADTRTVARVDALAAEIGDRFGRLPEPAATLFELRRLRLAATAAGVESLMLRGGGVQLEMARPLKRADVQRLMRQMPVPVQFQTHGRHRVEVEAEAARGQSLLIAAQVLECLAEPTSA
jgi:transcription-repair coupling factor (superfamily II helicase)